MRFCACFFCLLWFAVPEYFGDGLKKLCFVPPNENPVFEDFEGLIHINDLPVGLSIQGCLEYEPLYCGINQPVALFPLILEEYDHGFHAVVDTCEDNRIEIDEKSWFESLFLLHNVELAKYPGKTLESPLRKFDEALESCPEDGQKKECLLLRAFETYFLLGEQPNANKAAIFLGLLKWLEKRGIPAYLANHIEEELLLACAINPLVLTEKVRETFLFKNQSKKTLTLKPNSYAGFFEFWSEGIQADLDIAVKADQNILFYSMPEIGEFEKFRQKKEISVLPGCTLEQSFRQATFSCEANSGASFLMINPGDSSAKVDIDLNSAYSTRDLSDFKTHTYYEGNRTCALTDLSVGSLLAVGIKQPDTFFTYVSNPYNKVWFELN